MVVRKLIQIFGLALTSLLVLAFFATKAQAATFTVDSVDDGGNTGGPGVCDDGGGKCTLRAAIEAANTTAGADVINFAIPGGGGVNTITPALPYEITEQVTIDGSTQTGASCGTLVPASLPASSNTPHVLKIEIDGSGMGTGSGLELSSGSDGSVIRGLVVNDAQSRPEIQINANSVTVECNYIGTNVSGTAAGASNTGSGLEASGASLTIQNNLISANEGRGMYVSAYSPGSLVANNLVGVTANGLGALANMGSGIVASQYTTVSHNIVSGNTTDGIFIQGYFNRITDSYIGLSMNGSALGNGGSGINTDRTSNDYRIGGSSAGEGNIISANANNGISIRSQSGIACPANQISYIFGNKIGTNVSGEAQSGYGNGGSGISASETVGGSCVTSVYKHQIGGGNSGEGNVIAGNAQDGVRVYEYNNPEDDTDHTDVFSISVVQNSIFGNGNLGINLASASDPFNDVANVDLGPNSLNSFLIDYPASRANNYLNSPIINSLSTSGNNITVNYSFQAPPRVVENPNFLLASNLVGYRLDFYLNNGTQDGAYSGYSQGKTHLGSFVVNGSEAGATHTFTSPVALNPNQNITATATILWQVQNCSGQQDQNGAGPPYGGCGG
ncbi:right-handed parallel beta-helix repeat-containing protein [Candidatus Saccharibacteria bacterium]|nr:right-handed parallel beta-helix repeat-containing protein [Candidatus Saccharibacteria bacterium]